MTTTTLGQSTTYYVSNYYEVTDGVITKYYYAGNQRIAMRKDGVLTYILGDHLGSTSIVTDANGTVLSDTKYKAWGEERYTSGTKQTPYSFTGQYGHQAEFGLLFYNSRYYDPSLSRFTSADSIVPGGVQGLDRYAYVNNSPVKYTDPSGHVPACDRYDSACQFHSDIPIIPDNAEYSIPLTDEQAKTLDFVMNASEFLMSIAYDPLDWTLTAGQCMEGQCSPWVIVFAVTPIIPGSAGRHADDAIQSIINSRSAAFLDGVADLPIKMNPGCKGFCTAEAIQSAITHKGQARAIIDFPYVSHTVLGLVDSPSTLRIIDNSALGRHMGISSNGILFDDFLALISREFRNPTATLFEVASQDFINRQIRQTFIPR